LALCFLAFVGWRRWSADRDTQPPPTPRRARVEPPPLPVVLELAPPPEAATGIRALPAGTPPSRAADEPPATPPLPPLDFPDEPVDVELPAKVCRYQAPRGKVPPPVQALGKADRYHRAPWVVSAAHDRPIPVVLMGVLLTLGSAALLLGMGGAGDGLVIPVGFLALAGIFIAVLPFLHSYFPAYLIYRQALVVVEGCEFVVIPWEAVVELNHPRTLVTAGREKFELSSMASDLGGLYDTVQARVRDVLLTPMLAALENGRPVRFGPVAVSPADLYYGGRVIGWQDVSRMVINVLPREDRRVLTLWSRRENAPCEIDLNQVPNDWLLLELVKRVCPPHLLVPLGR
jgi:hypothetical protein